MSLLISHKGEGAEFELPPAGNHVAVCYRIVDLGTQTVEYNGREKLQHKVLISWELTNEQMDDGRPFAISKRYTASLFDRAALRADLESWRGRGFTGDELAGFHLKAIVGKPCLVNVVHRPSRDGSRTYANVASVSPLPKGMPAPAQVNPSVIFDLAEFSQDVYDGLSDALKDAIARSPEWQTMTEGDGGTVPSEPSQSAQDDDDDIPF